MGEHVPLLHGKSKNHQLHSHQKQALPDVTHTFTEEMLLQRAARKGVYSMSTEDNKALLRRFYCFP